MKQQRSQWQSPGIDIFVIIALIVILSAYVWSVCRLNLAEGIGFTLDDGWIHAAFAKNLFSHHIWSINTNQSTGGATSILWILLLTGGELFSSNLPAISLIWNIIFLIVLGVLLPRYWRDWTNRPLRIALLSLIVLSAGNLIWFAFSGMEVLLVLVCGLIAIDASARKRWWVMLIFVGLSSLARPEGFLIALAILPFIPRDKLRYVIIPAVLGALITISLNYHLTGTLLPSTLAGRRWILGLPSGAFWNPIDIGKNFFWLIGVWSYRLIQFTFGAELLTYLGAPKGIAWFIALVSMAVTLIGFVYHLTRPTVRMAAMCLWGISQLLAYSIFLPTRGHGGRYQPIVLILVLFFFTTGLWVCWNKLEKTFAKAGLILLVVVSLSSLYTWNRITVDSLRLFDRVHVSAAKWIKQYAAEKDNIAAFDIGALGYFSNRTVIDLGGLIDPNSGSALYSGKSVSYMQRKKADYLVMIFPYTDPDVYFKQLGLDKLFKQGVLVSEKEFYFPLGSVNWSGDAARVLSNKIRIYKILWKTEN
jgi:hypothetical protein